MSKKTNETVVNGVVLTPELTDVLLRWQQWSPLDGSVPEMYLKSLSNIQDFLCELLVEFDGDDDMNELYTKQTKRCLTELIIVKKELKLFLPNKSDSDSN